MPAFRRLVLTALLLGSAAPIQADQLDVTGAEMVDMVHELERRSATAHWMLQAIRFGRVPVVIGSRARLAADMRRLSEEWDPRAQRAVGMMAAVFAPGSDRQRVGSILITLDLERIREIYAAAAARTPSVVPWSAIRGQEMLAVLGHELTHAYALVIGGGDIRAQCDDPPKGAQPSTSCVVLAENVIRSQLGVPLDWNYGMPDPVDVAAAYADLAERRAALDAIGHRTTLAIDAFLSSPSRP